jgi:hypothetical protein
MNIRKPVKAFFLIKNIMLHMKSEKQIPTEIKHNLDKFEGHIHHYKADSQEKIVVLKTVNSRWQVTLFIKLGENIVIDTWRKPVNTLTKEQRLAALKELVRISLCDKLTQKTLSEMLGVSTSTIQASLAELDEGGRDTA